MFGFKHFKIRTEIYFHYYKCTEIFSLTEFRKKTVSKKKIQLILKKKIHASAFFQQFGDVTIAHRNYFRFPLKPVQPYKYKLISQNFFQDDSTVSTTIQCNRNIVVRGNLYANNIETPAVYVKTLNGRIWEPSTWLLNNTDQHINLKSREHENFMAKNVQVNDEDSLLHSKYFYFIHRKKNSFNRFKHFNIC